MLHQKIIGNNTRRHFDQAEFVMLPYFFKEANHTVIENHGFTLIKNSECKNSQGLKKKTKSVTLHE